MFQHQEQTATKTTSTGAGRRVLRAVPTPIQSQAAYIPMPDREDVDGERTKSIFSTRGTRDVEKMDHVEQAQGQAQAGNKVISAEEEEPPLPDPAAEPPPPTTSPTRAKTKTKRKSQARDLLSAANPRLTLFYLALQTFTIGAPYGFISSLGKLDLAPRVHPTDVVPSYTVTTFLIMLRTSQIAAFPVSYLVDVMGGRIGSLCASALVALGAFSLSYSVASAAEGRWALDPDPGLRPLFVLAAVCFGLSACFQIVSVMLSLRTLFSFAFSQFAVTLLNGCFDSSAIMFTLVGTVSLAVSKELSVEAGVDGEDELHVTNANAFSAGLVIYGCVALAHFFGVKWLYPTDIPGAAGAEHESSMQKDPKLRGEKSKINTNSLLTRASRTIAEWSPRLMMPHGDHSGASEISTTGPPTPEELLANGVLSTKSPTPSSLATPLLSGKISSFSSSALRDDDVGETSGHLQQDIILSVPHEDSVEKQNHNMNFGGCPPPGGGLRLETTPWRTWVTLRPGKKDVTLSFWKTVFDRDYLLSILWFAVQFQNFTNYLTQMPDIFAPQVLNVSGYFYPVSIVTACILGTAFNYVQNPSVVVCTTTASGLLFQTMVYWLVCDAVSAGAVVDGAAVVAPQGPNPGMTSTLADGVGVDQNGVGLHPSAPEISHGPHQQLPPRPPTTSALGTTPVEENYQNVQNLPLQFAVLLFLPFFRSGLFSTMWIYWPWVWQGSSHIGAMYGFATFFSFLFSSFLIAFVLLPRHGETGMEAVAMNEQWMQIYATVSILYSIYAVATHEYRTRVGGGRGICSS